MTEGGRFLQLFLCISCCYISCYCLTENAKNVQSYTTYKSQRYTTKCKLFGWGRCTKYRQVSVLNLKCSPGYRSKDDVSCPFAVCDGDTNPEACNMEYQTSHIKYSNGVLQYSSGGSCDLPDVCYNCNKGFFHLNARCKMCTAISNCDLEECMTPFDQTCSRCEGVVLEQVGHRAHVLGGDKKSCIKTCSWRSDSTYCYPGTCAQERATSCVCSTGFTGDKCHKITDKPNINYNILRLTADNGDTSEAPRNINSGPAQDASWSNIVSPVNLYYEFSAEYRMLDTLPPKHAFIEGFSVGIVGASASFKVKRGGSYVKTKTITCLGSSRDSPDTNKYSCQKTLSPSRLLPLPLQHLDTIKFSFEARNGGYVMVRNKENNVLSTNYYEGSSQTHGFSLSIDLVNPYHCTGTSACVHAMLALNNLIDTPVLNLQWMDWHDLDSGISRYVVDVFELHAVGESLRAKGRVEEITVQSATSTSVRLPEAGIYSVTLSVYDTAGNHKSTRRLVLFDGTSSVTTQVNTRLQVTTVSTDSPDWQTNTQRITITWTNRYINTLHHNNKWLLGVAPVTGVDPLYDDMEGERTLLPINNIQGIVSMSTAYMVDHAGGKTIEGSPAEVDFISQGLNQSQTISPTLEDGDTLRFWVRASDLMSNIKEESVTVHLDTSPPIIDNLWLTRGQRVNVSVHSLPELSEMTFEWIAYDLHSGLDTVSWRIVDRFEGRNIVHGIQYITAQGGTSDIVECTNRYAATSGANCYCTPASGCYHRHFKVKPSLIDRSQPHGGVFNHKYKGVHDSDYYIEVTVTNQAKLTTTKPFKITIDTSPPLSGHVHEGQPGQPEIDYQEDFKINAHWGGFFDKESGIKMYQYGFADECLKKSHFTLENSSMQIFETFSTTASWRAPSDGNYHVTVMAYNRALEGSVPVCSDGVTIDTTPPCLNQVNLLHSRTAGGVVQSSDGSIWIIDGTRKRSLVTSPDSECTSKAVEVESDALDLIPTHRLNNGSLLIRTNDDCLLFSTPPASFVNIIYLAIENELYLNWTGTDSESGIYDYELGLMSAPSGQAAPDILHFTSTYHHPHYQGFHPGLTEGREFYVALKVINKARLATTKVLGPVIVHTMAPVFNGRITVELSSGSDYLIAEWNESAFADPEPVYLQYEVAVGTESMSASVRPFSTVKSGGSCVVTSPPTCAFLPVGDLHWDLHHSHTYFVSIRVTNVVGLSVIAVSDPYVHDVRLPSYGVVIDLCPEEIETMCDNNEFEDADHQVSTTALAAKWYGFDRDGLNVTYRIGVGTQPQASNVKKFKDVGSALEYKYVGLKLTENQKYFLTVEARSSAGRTVSSSDGVVVIKKDVDMIDVVIRDGPGCRQDLLPAANIQECVSDLSYQKFSTTFSAHWSRSEFIKRNYPDVYWSLQALIPYSDNKWETVRVFEHLGASDKIRVSDVALEPGQTYRAAVKFCAVHICSKIRYSDGITVVLHPPHFGNIVLQYRELGTLSQIKVEMERFYDPDIPVRSLAYHVMEKYEWSLTDDSHDSKSLTNWQFLDPESMTVDGDKIHFTIDLPGHLRFTKCRRLSVRGHNKAGLHAVVSADVKDCQAFDPTLITPSVVLDVRGETMNINIGKVYVFDPSETIADSDYTPHQNILSAVWPTLRHKNYTWAVISGDHVDPTFYFKRESIMTVADPCAIPDVIQCGNTANEFINVLFSPELYLQHGKKFYFCIHAGKTNSVFEKWTADLPEVIACSDGITVDLKAPTTGTVRVTGLTKSNVQVSTTTVDIEWSGFTDLEQEGVIPHLSGISYYEVALGSTPAGQDVRKFIRVGTVSGVVLHSLNLVSGSTLYASVRATDYVNKTTTAVSAGFLVDATAPELTRRQLQVDSEYMTSRLVHVCWLGVFVDEESGMEAYMVALGTRPGYDDIVEFALTDQQCHDVDTFNNVYEGHQYYITVKGYNTGHLSQQTSSGPLTVVNTAPTPGFVHDRQVQDPSLSERDYYTSDSGIGVRWGGFVASGSSINLFKIKVGTCFGCDDRLKEFEVGIRSEYHFQQVSFSTGIKYFTTVTACNAAGICSSATSDGFIVDTSRPVLGTVSDGTGDADVQFQSSRTFLGCKWRGFFDPESGLHHYEWRVGTSPGGEDILHSRNSALTEVDFHILPRDQQLPVGKRLYVTVRAYNKAGIYSEVTSNGILVDISSPNIITQPDFDVGFGSTVALTGLSRTSVKVIWSFTDEESFIDVLYLSLSSHLCGDVKQSTLKVPGFLKEYIFTNLDLHDGSRYKVNVVACNMAGLCTLATTDTLLVDGSKPTTGTLSIETEHAAGLSRHLADWMTWTSRSLRLAWLGFSDLHSGIDHYIVAVGSQPFASDLNKDAVGHKVLHSVDGNDKGDEGIVQTGTIPTKGLVFKQLVFISIVAVNTVGLISDTYYGQLRLEGDHRLWLVRRCQHFSCEGHCVCSSEHGVCDMISNACLLADTNINSVVTVKDVLNLTFPLESVDVDYSPLKTVMAATWSVTTSQGLHPMRYDHTVGECDDASPHGVFDVAKDRVWFDSGTSTSAIITLPPDTYLTSGTNYCFFVRAWYQVDTYGIFKSDGISIDEARLSHQQISGTPVRECKSLNSCNDIDYQTDRNTITISWSNHILPGNGNLLKYKVYIGTKQGGHSIHESEDLTDTIYTATGLSLETNTVYYSSVLAYNKAGLTSWAYSDGVQLDMNPPLPGLVHDGHDTHDVDYHSSPSLLSASWNGFCDTGSAIVKYYWCVGTRNDDSDCGVVGWTDTGLHTTRHVHLPNPIRNGTTLFNKVYAVDTVGHVSPVAISDGIVFDSSAPEPQIIVYLGNNILENPSFETPPTGGDNKTSCTQIPSWNSNNQSCIMLASPDSLLAHHGTNFVSVTGSIQQTIKELDVGKQYKISLHVGYPRYVSSTHTPVEIVVLFGADAFAVELHKTPCRGICSSEYMSVTLWHKYTYTVTAMETTAVLAISSLRRNAEFVLDDVGLHRVVYVSPKDAESHLETQTVFLSHWSSIHATWQFVDPQSPIRNYKWAIGTMPGGTQLQRYKNVGHHKQGTLTLQQLSHNTTLYVTVMATNAAGLSSVSYSRPITVDLTPPRFRFIRGGSVLDTDNQSRNVVYINWQAEDDESGIKNCDWAIGSSEGRSDVKKYERVSQGQTSAEKDISSILQNTNSITVYSTVRCHNNVGLVSSATSSGVTVSNSWTLMSLTALRILPENSPVHGHHPPCHYAQNKIRLHWKLPQTKIKSLLVGIDGPDRTYQHNLELRIAYTYSSLSTLALHESTTYEVFALPCSVLGNQGGKVGVNLITQGPGPNVSDQVDMNVTRGESVLTLSWHNLFISRLQIQYEIRVGTVEGGADVIPGLSTTKEHVTLTLPSPQRKQSDLHITIGAVDTCGNTVYYSKKI